MVRIVGVRFKKAGKIYYFDPSDKLLDIGEDVIVETARGLEYGVVVIAPKYVEKSTLVSPLKPIIRIANTEDKIQYQDNKRKTKECFEQCKEKIEEHGLDMDLKDCEYTFDRNKLIFYFTADGRVDFRELVKDLAAIFRTRIELRQIGVRDEAKLLSGLGPCGRKLCCSSWLGDFQPVSIKMAKDQNLSLNPAKISGICGRLFCCLKYEYDNYSEILDRLPSIGSLVKVENPDANAKEKHKLGKVFDINPLVEEIRVQFKDGTIKTYKNEDVEVIKKARRNDNIRNSSELDEETLKELSMLEEH